jgi:tetratricopeptide (TPR) repeat protein
MTDASQLQTKQVATRKAMLLALVCLTVGIAGGWSIHRVQRATEKAGSLQVSAINAPVSLPNVSATESPSSAQLKQIADTHAAPLLDQLKADPENPDLLAGVGNIYYDAKQYALAIDYYARALKAKPANTAVRTDMATSYWYMGNADTAIAEFDKALSYEPNNPNTLFNLGLVRWKAKRDGAGALGDWQKLLATNPNYEGKDKVEALVAEVRQTLP